MCAASLAHHGVLGSVKKLLLVDLDRSPVPAQHLASLVSSVTKELSIMNVTGCDMVGILSSLKCQHFSFDKQSLGSEETRALVLAMESGVEYMFMGGDFTLDIKTLSKYSGQGVCRKIHLGTDATIRYREDLRTWARNRKWKGLQSGLHYIVTKIKNQGSPAKTKPICYCM